jgi:hypothetical protein
MFSTTELVRFGRLSLTGGPTLSVSSAIFFLRKPDRAPTPPPPPRSPAAPTTPPLPRQNELAPLFLFPDSPFHLPTRNGFAIEVPPSCRWLLLDRPPLVIPRPINAILEHRLQTTVPALASIRSTRARDALPPSSTHRRLHSSTSGHHHRRTTSICLW